MAKVLMEMSMSLDGFCSGPDDGKEFPNGRDGIKHVFGWLSRAKEEGGMATHVRYAVINSRDDRRVLGEIA